jgi:hypothetical protein
MTIAPKTVEELKKQKNVDETIRGVAPTKTVGETYAPDPVSKLADLATLFKLRVTSLIVLSTWAGYYMAAQKHHLQPLNLRLIATLVGVAMVACASAAFNQVIERDADVRMSRTKNRPLPTKRMTVRYAYTVGIVVGVLGCALLCVAANVLTGFLALATALTYIYVYTPLRPSLRIPLSSEHFPAPCLQSSDGPPHPAKSNGKRWRSSPFPSSGSSHISSRSHGSIVRTTSAPESVCCPSSTAPARPPHARFSVMGPL